VADKPKKHEDTRISLDGMTIEEALKKAIDAGPYPKEKEPKKAPPRSSRDTSQPAPQSDREG